MNDPWDVQSVHLSDQYVSCMKINGVPLLPPLLSKQCRKEMQYYKLLAKEVENRIAHLKTFNKDCSSSDDSLHELECEYSTPRGADPQVDTIRSTPINPLSTSSPTSDIGSPTKVTLNIDSNAENNFNDSLKILTLPLEIPERDCSTLEPDDKKPNIDADKVSERFEQQYDYEMNSIDLPDTMFHGPSSLSSKSFTGSLNDLHSEVKELDKTSKLMRQNSYTILQPSPQLMAHLQVQSQCTGMDIMSISMSESLSNISTPHKKRRSWDLETAKVKWSSMAMELKKKNVLNHPPSHSAKSTPKSTNYAPAKSKSQTVDRPARQNTKILTKSEPIQRPKKTNTLNNNPTDKTLTKADTLPRNKKDNKLEKESNLPKAISVNSHSEDPASKVRELYEKVQHQQLLQMASLIEKQKKEQMILQKIFDDQQSLLLKQLKTICPESPKEVKQAWGNSHEADTGPVSLSQLIQSPTHKSPDQHLVESTVSSLHDTNKYIDHCDNVLKKSKDLSSSLKKQTQSTSGMRQSPRLQDGSTIRPFSPAPNHRSTPASRKLNYDTSTSYEYEPLYTDRTNDTFADLNVTFPSDSEDLNHNTVIDNPSNDETVVKIDSAIKNMQEKIKKSMKDINTKLPTTFKNAPSQKELAAASRITAFARGYLVRRLLRTERVQGTVQTIKDALLCALQLHQDREGIRGADVDLHRRLIQQITAACYCLHDTFVVSSPAERCAMIAADRAKRRASASKQPPLTYRHYRPTNI